MMMMMMMMMTVNGVWCDDFTNVQLCSETSACTLFCRFYSVAHATLKKHHNYQTD